MEWKSEGYFSSQVMRLGGQVRSFSLGPGQEVLATAHEEKKGIYLWANQFIFGGAADIMPSDEPVDISLPSIAAGIKPRPSLVSSLPSPSQPIFSVQKYSLGSDLMPKIVAHDCTIHIFLHLWK